MKTGFWPKLEMLSCLWALYNTVPCPTTVKLQGLFYYCNICPNGSGLWKIRREC